METPLEASRLKRLPLVNSITLKEGGAKLETVLACATQGHLLTLGMAGDLRAVLHQSWPHLHIYLGHSWLGSNIILVLASTESTSISMYLLRAVVVQRKQGNKIVLRIFTEIELKRSNVKLNLSNPVHVHS